MSSRQKARLRMEEEARNRLARAAEVEEDDELDEEDEEDEEPRPKGFAFLSDSDESSSEEESEEENVKMSTEIVEKLSAKDVTKETEDREKMEMEALDEAIQLAKMEDENGHAAQAECATGLAKLLSIKDLKSLNPDNELKRKLGKFGAEVSASFHDSSTRTAASHGARRQGRGQQRRLGNALFCTLNDDERVPNPPTYASGGARMNIIGETEDGGTLFSFEASDVYRNAQNIFAHVQATHNPHQIIDFLHKYPSHVPGYLAMCDYHLQMSQLEAAEAMLRNTLYILECYIHPRFSKLIAEGKFRLDLSSGVAGSEGSDCGLNRIFVQAIFKSMMICRRKTLTHTALSLGQLLYSFNPEKDPCYIALILDQLALRDQSYKFIISAYEEHDSFQALPNMAYSYALALHRVGDEAKATKAAHNAFLSFPSCLPKMVKELEKASVTVSDAMIQSAVEKCNAIEKRRTEKDIEVDRLCEFFAISCPDTWKSSHQDIPPYQWLAFQVSSLEDSTVDGKASRISMPEAKEIRARYATVRLNQFVDETGALNIVGGFEDGAGGAVAGGGEPNVDLNANWIALFFQTMMPWSRLPPQQPPTDNDE